MFTKLKEAKPQLKINFLYSRMEIFKELVKYLSKKIGAIPASPKTFLKTPKKCIIKFTQKLWHIRRTSSRMSCENLRSQKLREFRSTHPYP